MNPRVSAFAHLSSAFLLACGLPIGASAQSGLEQDYAAAGVIASEDRVVISSQLSARIVELPFKEGQRFEQGDRLVAFDCARFDAELKEARAALGASGARHRVNRELLKHGAIGDGDVRVSGAETAAAAARVEALGELVKFCEVKAPFAGIVEERMFNTFETPSEGDEVMRVVNDGALTIEIIAPSIWLRWLAPGAMFEFDVRETGQTIVARVERLGASVDPVSQTIDVVAELVGDRGRILPGMSGVARFAPETADGG